MWIDLRAEIEWEMRPINPWDAIEDEMWRRRQAIEQRASSPEFKSHKADLARRWAKVNAPHAREVKRTYYQLNREAIIARVIANRKKNSNPVDYAAVYQKRKLAALRSKKAISK